MLKLDTYYAKQILENNKMIDNQSNPLATSLVIKLNEMALKIGTKKGAEDYYAKKSAYYTYPEYLFGINKEDVKDNLCVINPDVARYFNLPDKLTEINGYPIYDLFLLGDRKALYKSFIEYLDMIFKNDKKKTGLARARDRIRFFDMIPDGNEKFITEEIVDIMEQLENSKKNVMPLLAVLHTDEEYLHIHFMYMLDKYNNLNKKDLNKIPHIEEILSL